MKGADANLGLGHDVLHDGCQDTSGASVIELNHFTSQLLFTTTVHYYSISSLDTQWEIDVTVAISASLLPRSSFIGR